MSDWRSRARYRKYWRSSSILHVLACLISYSRSSWRSVVLRQVVSRSDCKQECRGAYRRSTERLWLRVEVRLLLGVALRVSTLSMFEEDGEFIMPGSPFIGFRFTAYLLYEVLSGKNRTIRRYDYQKKRKHQNVEHARDKQWNNFSRHRLKQWWHIRP